MATAAGGDPRDGDQADGRAEAGLQHRSRYRESGSQQTFCWREMDSNFQYASTVRWHRATDLPLPPTVKRRSAGRPPPTARPRSEAQRGSVRPAARHLS